MWAGDAPDVVEALCDLGVERQTATMVVPYVWFTPGTSDPYSPIIIMLIRGVQNGLTRIGYRGLRRDGFVGKKTSAALTQVAGHNWKGKAWIQIYGDILNTIKSGVGPRRNAMSYHSGMGAYEELGLLPGETLVGRDRFVVRGGVCLPVKGPPGNLKANLNLAKDFQRQLNRLLSITGKRLIGVDGEIGPGTLNGWNTGGAPAMGFRTFSSCAALTAEIIRPLVNNMSALATSKGVPAKVSAPRPKPRSRVVDPVTGGIDTVSTAGFDPTTFLRDNPMLAGAAALVAVLLFLKKRKGGKKTARKR